MNQENLSLLLALALQERHHNHLFSATIASVAQACRFLDVDDVC